MKFRLLAAVALSALLLGPVAIAQTTAPAAPAPAATGTPATTSTPAARPATPPAARPAAPAARPAAPTGQFKTEAEARAHCPADAVVWINKETKVYHLTGTRYFGKTKAGAYMCQKEADAAKFHVSRSRNETTPAATATPAPRAATPATPAPRAAAPAATAPATTAPAAPTAAAPAATAPAAATTTPPAAPAPAGTPARR